MKGFMNFPTLRFSSRLLPGDSIFIHRQGEKPEKSIAAFQGAVSQDAVLKKTLLGELRKFGEETELSSVLVPSGKSAHRVHILRFSQDAKNQSENVRQLGYRMGRFLQSLSCKEVNLCGIQDMLSEDVLAQAFFEGLGFSSYFFGRYRSKQKPIRFPKLNILATKAVSSNILQRAKTLVQGTFLARDLINLSPRHCTPSYLAKTAREMARRKKMKVEVFGRVQLRRMGAGLLLAVGQGGGEEPLLIRISYKPKKKSKSAKKLALIGKGITFDSGGLCIKPGTGMYDMKGDMSGAACVLGVMQAIGEIRPDREIVAYIPTTENMLGPQAMKPGDVFKAMNGKTVEVLNTDAEGRLILADALSLAVKDGCEEIIDVATLTGACVVALGTDVAGVFSNTPALSKKILEAARQAGESMWELPLEEAYRKQLDSLVADLKNIGNGRDGGAIIAALFLREFIGKANWVHIDIAGPATRESEKGYLPAGGVGYGVRSLVEHLVGR